MSCLSSSSSGHTGILQILTQVDRLSKHQDFFVKAVFVSVCAGLWLFEAVSMRDFFSESSRMWLWLWPSQRQQPRASPNSCQRALETVRDRELPCPQHHQPAFSYCRDCRGDGHTYRHIKRGEIMSNSSASLCEMSFKDAGVYSSCVDLFVFSQMDLPIIGLCLSPVCLPICPSLFQPPVYHLLHCPLDYTGVLD